MILLFFDIIISIFFKLARVSKLSRFYRLLKLLKPEIVILLGNLYETFSAAIAASQNNIPIAHIQGDESNFGTWDDSYGYGITKLSHLHFTTIEKYRQQVIRFGESSEKVFNVGSLLVEKIKTLPSGQKIDIYFKKY